MKYRLKKNQELIPVDEPKEGQLYHVVWAYSKGVVGRCISVDHNNKTVKLRTPKTKKDFKYPVSWDQLRHTRNNQIYNKH